MERRRAPALRERREKQGKKQRQRQKQRLRLLRAAPQRHA
jgi:hypothetical protein